MEDVGRSVGRSVTGVVMALNRQMHQLHVGGLVLEGAGAAVQKQNFLTFDLPPPPTRFGESLQLHRVM